MRSCGVLPQKGASADGRQPWGTVGCALRCSRLLSPVCSVLCLLHPTTVMPVCASASATSGSSHPTSLVWVPLAPPSSLLRWVGGVCSSPWLTWQAAVTWHVFTRQPGIPVSHLLCAHSVRLALGWAGRQSAQPSQFTARNLPPVTPPPLPSPLRAHGNDESCCRVSSTRWTRPTC